jgi:hypothetical protein
MNTAIQILVPLSIGAGLALALSLVYPPLAMATTREAWTHIVRRNKVQFLGLTVPALVILVWWGGQYGPLQWFWTGGATYSVTTFAYGVLMGHFYWAGVNPAKIHRPTAWRCVEELKGGGFDQAADHLAAALDAKGYPFAPSDRHGRRRPL